VKVKVTLRPTISRTVRLDVRHPPGSHDQDFILLEIFFRQLLVFYFVAPYLTRGRVCNLLLLLALASAVPLASDSRRTQDHILLSQFLRLGSLSVASYDSQGLRWRYSNPPPHGSVSRPASFSLRFSLDSFGFVIL
jgi:hypothetical protein